MKIIPLLALHGHFGGGRELLPFLLIFVLVALVLAFWPDKSQTK
jgi:hypothetical protein